MVTKVITDKAIGSGLRIKDSNLELDYSQATEVSLATVDKLKFAKLGEYDVCVGMSLKEEYTPETKLTKKNFVLTSSYSIVSHYEDRNKVNVKIDIEQTSVAKHVPLPKTAVITLKLHSKDEDGDNIAVFADSLPEEFRKYYYISGAGTNLLKFKCNVNQTSIDESNIQLYLDVYAPLGYINKLYVLDVKLLSEYGFSLDDYYNYVVDNPDRVYGRSWNVVTPVN